MRPMRPQQVWQATLKNAGLDRNGGYVCAKALMDWRARTGVAHYSPKKNAGQTYRPFQW